MYISPPTNHIINHPPKDTGLLYRTIKKLFSNLKEQPGATNHDPETKTERCRDKICKMSINISSWSPPYYTITEAARGTGNNITIKLLGSKKQNPSRSFRAQYNQHPETHGKRIYIYHKLEHRVHSELSQLTPFRWLRRELEQYNHAVTSFNRGPTKSFPSFLELKGKENKNHFLYNENYKDSAAYGSILRRGYIKACAINLDCTRSYCHKETNVLSAWELTCPRVHQERTRRRCHVLGLRWKSYSQL